MYFTFPCPECGKQLKVRQDAAGRRAGCPYCKHSLTVPVPAPEPEPETDETSTAAFQGIGVSEPPSYVSRGAKPKSKPKPQKTAKGPRQEKTRVSTGGGWSDRTDVNMLHATLLGLAIYAVMLLALFPMRSLYLGELFYARGWVPFVLLLLLGWSIAILVLKSRKIKRQKQALLFDLLPTDISESINEVSIHQFTTHIGELPVAPSESFLINRVVRGLEHFRVRKSNPEVASVLASQSEIDANAVQSSYTLLNVFIWAIPILGFIGTVIGISAAVGGFSGSLEQAQDISVLKESLNGVTGGLATAFDTTLVALVMSILVMFPSSSMQKSEEDLLNSVDEYCNENLLKRLDDGNAGLAEGGSTLPVGSIQKAIDVAMARHHAELQAWNTKLESIGATLTEQVVAGWTQVNQKIQESQAENVEQIKDIDAMTAAFGQSLQAMSQRSEAVHGQAAGSIATSAETLRAYYNALHEGLAGLNRVLGELDQKQVTIETRRRGWFSRR